MVCPLGDPTMVKPVPLTLAWVIVTLADPVLDKFTDTDPVAPTTTFPKLTDAGVLARPGCVPVPVNATERGEFDASLATVKLPVALPVACGANAICTVTLCPTASDPEGFPEAIVYPAPVIEADDTFTAVVPVFVTVKLCVAVLPIPTFPKATVATLPDNTPALPVLVLAPVYPTQPDSPTIATNAVRNATVGSGPRRIAPKNRLVSVI
jgi:hypothetical protein